MVYTVIARTDILNKYFEKWDCSKEQPLNLINDDGMYDEFIPSPDVMKYISDTKNEKTKKERISAYTTLFFSLYTIYNIKPKEILRTELDRPYIKEDVFFSISHSDAFTAVTLSDDFKVGTDIQECIAKDRGEKVVKRFLGNFSYEEADFGLKYLYITLNEDNNLSLYPIEKKNISDFNKDDIFLFAEDDSIDNLFNEKISYTKMWTAAESMLKLNGGGLFDLSKLSEISKDSLCTFLSVRYNNRDYIVATSIYK